MRIARRWVSIAVIVLAAGLTAACGGPPPPSSWSGLVVFDQTAYLTAADRVYAIDTNESTNNAQRLKWAFPPIGENAGVTFHGQPFLTEDGILYTGSDSVGGSAFIFALDTTKTVTLDAAQTTVEGKRYPAGENAPPLGNIYGGVTFDGQSVYAGTNDGRVVSVDAGLGRLNWVFTTTQRIWSTPVVSGENVYVAAQNHNLYALNAADGTHVWAFKAGAMLAGTPMVYGDTVYAGSFDQKLYAVDAATGERKWEFAARGWLWDGPAVYDNHLYFGDLNGIMYALNLDGTPAWNQPVALEGAVRAQPLVTEDRIFVGTQARKLYALNRADGSIIWTFTALQEGESLLTTPARVEDLLLVAPLPSGGSPIRLYALDVDSGNLQWQFPAPTPTP